MIASGQGGLQSNSEMGRRRFLRLAGLGSLGFCLPGPEARSALAQQSDRSVILLLLVGGPSQLETWDPKPDAPAEVRGPFRSIATKCPGVRISEHLPRMAARLDQVALVRSVHHDAAPIHETGQQLLQTGQLCRAGEEYPHLGSVVASLRGTKGSAAAVRSHSRPDPKHRNRHPSRAVGRLAGPCL